MAFDEAVQRIKERGILLDITFHPSAGQTGFSAALQKIADDLHRAAGGRISLSRGRGENLPGVPALAFQHATRGLIYYLALPGGKEEAPFIEMLTADAPGNAETGKDAMNALRELSYPVDITVFITSACPNCPHAVRAANQMAILSQIVTVAIVDVERFPLLAERFKIRSVPMTVIDNELLINEVIPVQELANKILAKQSDAYREEVFSSLVGTGNIELASRRLLEGGQEKYFLTSWKKSTLSTRIALLITAKQAMAEDPEILYGIVRDLIMELRSDNVSLKGDTADLLGMIGHPDAKEHLEALLHGDNADIVEIAQDALENLNTNR
jgi:hypothetical protein